MTETETQTTGAQNAGVPPAEGRPVLWLGAVFPDSLVQAEPAVSPAANEWQKKLLGALAALNVSVATVGHVPVPLSPRGRPRVRGERMLAEAGRDACVSYWNLPLLRPLSLRRGYVHAGRRLQDDLGRPSAVFSYNSQPAVRAAAEYFVHEHGIPWVPFHLDLVPPDPDWQPFCRRVGAATAHVFASWAAFKEAPLENKFFFEGGIEQVQHKSVEEDNSAPRTVVYAGGAGASKGLPQLLRVFQRLDVPNIRLVVCGKGTASLQNTVETASIVLRGFLPESEFDRVCRGAYCFVNPRQHRAEATRYNFPSKLLKYISYGKPVISHWTDGLSPEYREVLRVPEQPDEHGLERALSEVLSWSDERYRSEREKIARFAAGRSWTDRTRALMGQLATICDRLDV